MRKMMMLLAVLSMVTIPLFAQSAPDQAEPAQPAVQAPAPAQDVAPNATAGQTLNLNNILSANQPVQMSYPRCGALQGQACSPPGSFTRCQWTQFEPDICVCQSDNTWQCG